MVVHYGSHKKSMNDEKATIPNGTVAFSSKVEIW